MKIWNTESDQGLKSMKQKLKLHLEEESSVTEKSISD